MRISRTAQEGRFPFQQIRLANFDPTPKGIFSEKKRPHVLVASGSVEEEFARTGFYPCQPKLDTQ